MADFWEGRGWGNGFCLFSIGFGEVIEVRDDGDWEFGIARYRLSP